MCRPRDSSTRSFWSIPSTLFPTKNYGSVQTFQSLQRENMNGFNLPSSSSERKYEWVQSNIITWFFSSSSFFFNLFPTPVTANRWYGICRKAGELPLDQMAFVKIVTSIPTRNPKTKANRTNTMLTDSQLIPSPEKLIRSKLRNHHLHPIQGQIANRRATRKLICWNYILLLLRGPLHIVVEVQLTVHHCLIALPA